MMPYVSRNGNGLCRYFFRGKTCGFICVFRCFVKDSRRLSKILPASFLSGKPFFGTMPHPLPMAESKSMTIAKIVSGGQTGVDRVALAAALKLGFPLVRKPYFVDNPSSRALSKGKPKVTGWQGCARRTAERRSSSMSPGQGNRKAQALQRRQRTMCRV